ncbi:MAG: DUF3450 domain-containing protein [Methylococcaceae bacterium]|nr:DUF3450 domain-containing protein [Methylococcaceae bacterium]
MNFYVINDFRPVIQATVFGLVFSMPVMSAGTLDQAIDAGVAQNTESARSQQRIEKLDEETRRMVQEFRQNTRNADVLKKYNDHLDLLLVSQEKEKQSLEHQLKEIDVTQREIVPLMLRMLDSLEAFVSIDLPFLPEERRRRIEYLKTMMVSADATNAEKFRRILEAYQVEADYGRTIEAYRASLTIGAGDRPVDFLRLGRVALYYQTLDGSETGTWNQESKRWVKLPGEYKRAIRDGLRVARKEAAPDLLTLPIPGPEAVR